MTRVSKSPHLRNARPRIAVCLVCALAGCATQARKAADDALFGRRFREATDGYTAVLEEADDDYASVLGRGLAFEHLGQTKAAMEDYTRALELRPQAVWPRIYRAGLALKLDEADAAQEDIGVVMGGAFGSLTAHEQVLILGVSGQVQRAKGRPEEALQDFERAIEIAKRNPPLLALPHYADVLYSVAHTNYELGRLEEALQGLTDYMALKKKLSLPITSDDYYNMAVLTYLVGKFDESREYFMKVSSQQREKALSKLDDEGFLRSIRQAGVRGSAGKPKAAQPKPKPDKRGERQPPEPQ